MLGLFGAYLAIKFISIGRARLLEWIITHYTAQSMLTEGYGL